MRIIFSMTVVLCLAALGCEDGTSQDSPTTTAPATETDAPKSETVGAETSAFDSESTVAICELVPIGGSKVKGAVRFVENEGVVKVTGEVTGLEPGKHGFHVHEKGDLSDKETGKSAGGHFNPTDQPHGKMTDEKRHVGDLGNIEASEEGVATIELEDSVISLTGQNSIVGKSIVVHAGEDKFTQPTGDAGDRVAFGLIEKGEE